MKKIVLVFAVVFSFAMMVTSCKETKKEEVKIENHEGHDHSSDEIAMATYQCPMDCEKGKTYDAEGSCPVCKMDLKELKAEAEHADGCKCKEAGECTCADGKCSCKEKVACTKCAPGECSCDMQTADAKECNKCDKGACTCNA